jgi:polyisoprenoid-binding protein YceI
MKKLALAAAAMTALVSGAILTAPGLIAQETQEVPGAQDPSRISGGTYSADPAHSLVEFEVSHFGFNEYFGIFGDVEGTLMLDPADPESAMVDVTIPIAKVTTASADLTDHLLRPGKDGSGPDFFGADPAPARFVSTSITLGEDEMTAEIIGDLTINGITKPVTLETEFVGAGVNPFNSKETVGFEAETTIMRSDFGIDYSIPLVSDEVELEISVAFEKD